MSDPTLVERWEGWIIRVGLTPINTARCRGCGRVVLWCTTDLGRRMPIDRDGISHFATCPEADRFRRPRPRVGSQRS